MSEADRLFLETTRRFAPRRLAQEDVRAALRLATVASGKPVVDLGCGYGRHLRELIQCGYRAIGIDRSALLLSEAMREAAGAALVRADLRALPLHAASVAAAFCFYSSMFLGSEEDAVAAMREAARVLRPGGSLVLTTDNPFRLAANPRARFEQEVPGLGHLVEESAFDADLRIDVVRKTLRAPPGVEVSAEYRIRYYLPDELERLAASCGLQFVGTDETLTETTPQLIALFDKATD
jgi:SAM-dependent methyltransferase